MIVNFFLGTFSHLLAPSALAFDGSGAAPIAPSDSVIDPRYTWSGDIDGKGAWTVGAMGEGVFAPISASYDAGDGIVQHKDVLTDVVAFDVRGAFALSDRIGVGVVAPFFLHSQTLDTQNGTYGGDPAVGNVRVSLPLSLVRSKAGVGFSFGILPTLEIGSGTDPMLGGGYGGSLQLAAGYTRGWIHAGLDLGGTANGDGVYQTIDERGLACGSALLGLQPSKHFGIAAELWGEANVLGTPAIASSPAEVSLIANARIGEKYGLTLGFGHAIDGGAGAAQARVTLGFTYVGAAVKDLTRNDSVLAALDDAAKLSEPIGSGPPTPYDVLIAAADGHGKPIDAHVHIERSDAKADPQDWQLGKDGKARVPLAVGDWNITLSKDGDETQSRQIELLDGRFRPVQMDAVLLPKTGDQVVAVHVADNEARGVEGAELRVDGHLRGTTSTDGLVEIRGVAVGSHLVEATDADFVAPVLVPVPAQAPTAAPVAPTMVTMQRPPGSVRVVARSNHGIVDDAVVRFIPNSGDGVDPGPTPIGPEGEKTFQLAPGSWTAVVSAASFGVQERDVIIEPGQTALVSVDVVFAQEVGDAALNVHVVDTDGQPVEGAEVQLDNDSVGSTSNAGTLTVSGLKEGSATLAVRGHGLRATETRPIQLAAGTHDLLVTVDYLPGTVQILARGPDGPVADAMVRFVGPEDEPASSLGPDGRGIYSLKSGSWQLILSSAEYGLQTRDVVVQPDQTALIYIDARMLASEKGDASLTLSIVDPAGHPVSGAHLRLDGAEIGNTATGGDLVLGNLQPGTRAVVVTADIFQDYASDTVELKSGANTLAVKLKYKTDVVRLHAHDAANAPVDGVVRLYGAMAIDPASLGPTGERLFALTPGAWTAALSNEALGITEKDFAVKENPTPQLVDLLVTPPKAVVTSLHLAVVDPAGQPVHGALAVVGASTQALGDDGAVLLSGLSPGPYPLQVSAPGYKPAGDPKFSLAAGPQDRTLKMDWLPRTMTVSVHAPDGKPVDAEVVVQRFADHAANKAGKAQQTGADGTLDETLVPGTWRVIAVAPGFGAQQQDVALPAGEGAFPLTLTLTAAKVDVTAAAVTIKDQVHFATNSAAITEDSFKILDEVASTLIVHPELKNVEIQGHTDDVGGAELNLDLSQRRANAVKLYLTQKGIDAARITAKGYGATVPIAPNTTDAGRSQNRRVQFVIVK